MISKILRFSDSAVIAYKYSTLPPYVFLNIAELYAVETGQLNRAVKRNSERFPEDFMFQLSDQELTDLKCQFGISSSWGGRRTLPIAFTEQGVAMLSSVLKSKEAALVNVQIMRYFVLMRETLGAHDASDEEEK